MVQGLWGKNVPELTALHSCVGLGTPHVWFKDATAYAPKSEFSTPAFFKRVPHGKKEDRVVHGRELSSGLLSQGTGSSCMCKSKLCTPEAGALTEVLVLSLRLVHLSRQLLDLLSESLVWWFASFLSSSPWWLAWFRWSCCPGCPVSQLRHWTICLALAQVLGLLVVLHLSSFCPAGKGLVPPWLCFPSPTSWYWL